MTTKNLSLSEHTEAELIARLQSYEIEFRAAILGGVCHLNLADLFMLTLLERNMKSVRHELDRRAVSAFI
jgi:hypothetical protein